MDLPELSFDSLVEYFDDANSLQYITENDEELKNTIYSSLKKSKKRYWIKEKINEGGIKNILEVRDESTGRTVAMAVLKKCENVHHIEDFLREARITATLQHPGIMPIHDIGLNDADEPFFTMKLIKEGYDLSTAINKIKSGKKAGNYNNLNDRLELFLKICDAVAYAHSMGVIHLDLKPENIQLDSFGQVLICDWGLAQLCGTPSQTTFADQETATSLDFINITLNGMIKGTPGYMAPEQATIEKTKKDHRTDIYSLGAILYTLLTFRLPIRRHREVKKMLEDTQAGRIVPLKEWSKTQPIPESLKQVTMQAMSLDPNKRYQSVEELQNEIRSYLNGFATNVEEAGFFKLLKLFYQRNKVKFNLIVTSLILIVSTTSFMFLRLSKSEKLAHKNEQIAIQNAKKARESEQKLYDSLLKLKYAEMKTKDLELLAIPSKYAKAHTIFYNQKDFDKSYKLPKEITQTNWRDHRSWELLTVYAFTAQNFSDTIYYTDVLLSLEITTGLREVISIIKALAVKYQPLLNPKTKKLDEANYKALLKDCAAIPQVVIRILNYRNIHNQLTTKPRVIPGNVE